MVDIMRIGATHKFSFSFTFVFKIVRWLSFCLVKYFESMEIKLIQTQFGLPA